MPLTLTIADLGAFPTGFTATVADSAGAPVSLWAAPADQPFAGIAWAEVGARTGDGPVSVSVPNGFLFVLAKTATDCTLPVALAVTDGLDSLPLRIQAAVAARLRLANLPRIGNKVHEQLMPDATELRYPCAVTHWVGSVASEDTGLNALDYLSWPVQVDFYDQNPPTAHATRGLFLGWLDAAGKAFRHQRLPGVDESAWCDVRFGPLVNPAAAVEAGYYQGSLVVAAVCREARGLGA
jgi:hypothetical protein